jgi:uncharacterized protein
MDCGGVDVQVLSHTVPSPEILEPARDSVLPAVNDELAEPISRNPARFAGFASLPVADAPAASDEL